MCLPWGRWVCLLWSSCVYMYDLFFCGHHRSLLIILLKGAGFRLQFFCFFFLSSVEMEVAVFLSSNIHAVNLLTMWIMTKTFLKIAEKTKICQTSKHRQDVATPLAWFCFHQSTQGHKSVLVWQVQRWIQSEGLVYEVTVTSVVSGNALKSVSLTEVNAGGKSLKLWKRRFGRTVESWVASPGETMGLKAFQSISSLLTPTDLRTLQKEQVFFFYIFGQFQFLYYFFSDQSPRFPVSSLRNVLWYLYASKEWNIETWRNMHSCWLCFWLFRNLFVHVWENFSFTSQKEVSSLSESLQFVVQHVANCVNVHQFCSVLINSDWSVKWRPRDWMHFGFKLKAALSPS